VFHRLSDERADKLLNADQPKGDWPRKIEDNLTGFLGDGERTVNTGINGIFSSMYLIALRGALEMSKAVSPEDVADLATRIAVLEKSISEMCWNEEKGLFADTIEQTHFSPHASLFAVQAGAASPEQQARLRETLPAICEPFFTNGYDHTDGTLFETAHGYYLMESLYTLGLEDVAERIFKDAWGYMLKKGLITCAEHFNLRESQCHAWTAYPTYMYSRYVLGVRFDATSDKATIRPQPGSLTWAKGAFPHPKGLVEVEWRKVNGEIVFDRVAAPDGVEVVIG